MFHIMVHVHFFSVDVLGAPAIKWRHILEMGSNKWATAVKVKGAQHSTARGARYSASGTIIDSVHAPVCTVCADFAVIVIQ